MDYTINHWHGTFKLCPVELRKGDTATVNYDAVNKGNMFVGVEGYIPDLFLEGPLTRFQVLDMALAHANGHVQNMVYTKIDTRHCYGCEKVEQAVKDIKNRLPFFENFNILLKT